MASRGFAKRLVDFVLPFAGLHAKWSTERSFLEMADEHIDVDGGYFNFFLKPQEHAAFKSKGVDSSAVCLGYSGCLRYQWLIRWAPSGKSWA